MTLLISADTVIIHDHGQPVALSDHAVAITHGIISHVLPTDEALSTIDYSEHQHLADHILMPGLVNAHGHAAMSLLRGFSDDLALQQWLETSIWPAEAKFVSDDFVRDGSLLAIAEMLLSGTTCFSDMYFFPEAVAAAAKQVGIRTQLAFPIFDFASAWGNGPDDYISKGLGLFDTYKNSNLVHIAFGPHAPYTVGDEALRRVAVLSNELDAPVHIHLHETEQEVSDSIRQYGQRPLARLMDLGLLTARTQCVHMCALNDDDIALLRQTDASVIHCPQSNQKLASGICPSSRLLAQGVRVGLGTDSAASNNSLNLFTELKAAALQAKNATGDAASLNAGSAFNMATLGGAQALGLDNLCGSINVGKQADLVAINCNTPAMTPLYKPLSQLVYSEPHVSHVWVGGKQLVQHGELTSLSLTQTLNAAQTWARKIQA